MVNYEKSDDVEREREDWSIYDDDVVLLQMNEDEVLAFSYGILDIPADSFDPAIREAISHIGEEMRRDWKESDDDFARPKLHLKEAGAMRSALNRLISKASEEEDDSRESVFRGLRKKMNQHLRSQGIDPTDLPMPEKHGMWDVPNLDKLQGQVSHMVLSRSDNPELEVGQIIAWGPWGNGTAVKGHTPLKLAIAVYEDGDTPDIGEYLQLGREIKQEMVGEDILQEWDDWFPEGDFHMAEGDTVWISLAQWMANQSGPLIAYSITDRERLNIDEVEDRARDQSDDMGFDGGHTDAVVSFPDKQRRDDVHDAIKGRAQAIDQNNAELRCLFDLGQTLGYAEKNEPYPGAWLELEFDFEQSDSKEACAKILKDTNDPDLQWLGRQLE